MQLRAEPEWQPDRVRGHLGEVRRDRPRRTGPRVLPEKQPFERQVVAQPGDTVGVQGAGRQPHVDVDAAAFTAVEDKAVREVVAKPCLGALELRHLDRVVNVDIDDAVRPCACRQIRREPALEVQVSID